MIETKFFFIFTSCPLISFFTCSNAATTNSALEVGLPECAVYKSRNKFHFQHQTVDFITFSLVSRLFLFLPRPYLKRN